MRIVYAIELQCHTGHRMAVLCTALRNSDPDQVAEQGLELFEHLFRLGILDAQCSICGSQQHEVDVTKTPSENVNAALPKDMRMYIPVLSVAMEAA